MKFRLKVLAELSCNSRFRHHRHKLDGYTERNPKKGPQLSPGRCRRYHLLLIRLVSKTARIPVRKIPSKVPAPPIEATGAPNP